MLPNVKRCSALVRQSELGANLLQCVEASGVGRSKGCAAARFSSGSGGEAGRSG